LLFAELSMPLFMLIFFALYTAMHLLTIWACYPLLRAHAALPFISGIWTLLMVLSPALASILDHNGQEPLARAAAWIGYSWMGLVFYAFCLSALLAVWQLGIKAMSLIFVRAEAFSLYGSQVALLIALGSLLIGMYGFYEARDLRVERLELLSARLPSGMKSLSIALVSDMHLGLLRREEELGQVIAQLQQLKPDLLVATGDIVDSQLSHLPQLAELWQQVQPPLGKFAVTGNHEQYAGLQQALDFMVASGFRVLQGAQVEITPGVFVAGVDDPAGGPSRSSEAGLLRQLPAAALRIFLKHRPRVEEDSLGLFDLQLSGHAHRGQLFPFNLLTGLQFPLQDGFYALARGSALYTSRGTGTWGPPMRVGSPPEITLIQLISAGMRVPSDQG
jgi:predicted MPP superfamily phosphohydrolase